jgi:hypothetical protein
MGSLARLDRPTPSPGVTGLDGALRSSVLAARAALVSVAAVAALFALAGPCGFSSPALANEVGGSASGSGVRVHDPEETLRDYCTTDVDGRLWLQVPGGGRFELVTSTGDAAIANPGDGSFHTFDIVQVHSALAAVRFPLDGLDVEIFLLPYPRRGAFESGAGRGIILLSPGVLPLSAEQQNSELVHELGHVVQYQWMPDGDAHWSDYRRRRGIEDPSRYSATSIHADRPHEIFAEDFRALFGGALANYSGSIENADLTYPTQVSGLAEFMRGLPADAARAGLQVRGSNPSRGAAQFARAGAASAALDLYDVAGRRIATLAPSALGSETRWSWNGTDETGRRVPAGLMLARVRDGSGAATRVHWLP